MMTSTIYLYKICSVMEADSGGEKCRLAWCLEVVTIHVEKSFLIDGGTDRNLLQSHLKSFGGMTHIKQMKKLLRYHCSLEKRKNVARCAALSWTDLRTIVYDSFEDCCFPFEVHSLVSGLCLSVRLSVSLSLALSLYLSLSLTHHPCLNLRWKMTLFYLKMTVHVVPSA